MEIAQWRPGVGDCFLISSGTVGKHFFVLVLEIEDAKPPQVLLIPICSLRDAARADTTCILQPGEHDFIQHESFAEYRHARVELSIHVQKCVENGVFIKHTPATIPLVEKIKEGLVKSRFVARHIKTLLR